MRALGGWGKHKELPQNVASGAPRPPRGWRKRRLGAMDTLRPFRALGRRSGEADCTVSFSSIFCLSADGSGEEPHKNAKETAWNAHERSERPRRVRSLGGRSGFAQRL